MKPILALALSTALILDLSFAADPPKPALDLQQMQAELERLKGLVPDQAHIMADVGYHFTQAWFAGEAANWPLAQFYVNETKSHLGWAVRAKPVRKLSTGIETPLLPMADALIKGPLADLGKAIVQKSQPDYRKAWHTVMQSCTACHVAFEKPYLQLQQPERPAADIIRFQPIVQQ